MSKLQRYETRDEIYEHDAGELVLADDLLKAIEALPRVDAESGDYGSYAYLKPCKDGEAILLADVLALLGDA